MALATNISQGTVTLNGDIHGSGDALVLELTPTGVAPGVYNFASIVVDDKGRTLSIEEFAASDVPCATKISCGIVRIEEINLSVTNGIVDYAGDATSISKGVVQAGAGFSITSGILDVDWPLATTLVLGVGQVPSAGNLNIDISGNISAPIATTIALGLGQVPGGDGLSIDGSGNLTFDANILVDATTSSKGIVQIGNNIDVNLGVMSIVDASVSDKGVVQVLEGNGLILNVNTLEYTSAGLPIATTTTIGTVKLPIVGGLNVDGVGAIDADLSNSTTILGVIKSANANNISIVSSDMDIGSNVGVLSSAQLWGQSQQSDIETITYSASITPDFSLSNVFVVTLTGNMTINAPINAVDGASCVLIFKQDGVGGHTATFDSVYKFNNAPVLTSDANAVDLVMCSRLSSTQYLNQLQTNFS